VRETFKKLSIRKSGIQCESELEDNLMADEISQYVKGIGKRRTRKLSARTA
jgi:hypothetical protein